jgi:sulfate permease, SulP family
LTIRPIRESSSIFIFQKEDNQSLWFSFYIIETGILRAIYTFDVNANQRTMSESMLPGTVAGEFTFLSGTKRNAKVVAERDSVIWEMKRSEWDRMGKDWVDGREQVARMLMRCTGEETEVLMVSQGLSS